MELLLSDEAATVKEIPFEYLLYRRGYFDRVNYLELPHILTRYYEIILRAEAGVAQLAQLNLEIAAKHQLEHPRA